MYALCLQHMPQLPFNNLHSCEIKLVLRSYRQHNSHILKQNLLRETPPMWHDIRGHKIIQQLKHLNNSSHIKAGRIGHWVLSLFVCVYDEGKLTPPACSIGCSSSCFSLAVSISTPPGRNLHWNTPWSAPPTEITWCSSWVNLTLVTWAEWPTYLRNFAPVNMKRNMNICVHTV